MAVSTDGSIRTSLRGEDWTLQSRDLVDPVDTMAAGPGIVVAFHRGAVSTSSNGVSWRKESVPALAGVRKAVYGIGRFVAVGTDGTAYRSENGSQWLDMPTGVTNGLNDVVFGNGLFLAIGDSVALASTDGLKWERRPIPSNPVLGRAAFGSGSFVITAPSFSVLVSSNTVDWTKLAVPEGRNLDQIAFVRNRGTTKRAEPLGVS